MNFKFVEIMLIIMFALAIAGILAHLVWVFTFAAAVGFGVYTLRHFKLL